MSDAGASRAIRVVIVDDHPMIRQALRLAILTEENLQVVGEATDGEEALQVCERLHPDVVLMDLRLPGRLSSAETIRALQQRCSEGPVPQVLVNTAQYDETLFEAALAAGACAYILKNVSIEALCAAIRAAHGRPQAMT